MRRKLNGILKYSKRKKRFQGGGVTFISNPGMYKPEDDFYMKSAYARYSAANKPTKSNKTNTTKPTVDFLDSGPKGTRDYFNNKLQSQMDQIQAGIAANPDHLSTQVGIRQTSMLSRLNAELAGDLGNIDKSRSAALKELTSSDKTSQAFINGRYLVQNEKGDVSYKTPDEVYAEEGKYRIFTVGEALTKFDSIPMQNGSYYDDLSSIKAGNRFFKEDIMGMRSSYKAQLNGKPLTANQLDTTFRSLAEKGEYDQLGGQANLESVIAPLKQTIYTNNSALNSLTARVWSNPSYRDQLLKADEGEDRQFVMAKLRNAEIFRLAFIQGKPKAESKGTGNDAGKVAGGTLSANAFGIGVEKDKMVDITDMATHNGEGKKEAIYAFKAFKPLQVVYKVKELNIAAENSDGKKSANLRNQLELGKVIDFTNAYTPDNVSVAQGLGMTPDEFTQNTVIKDPDSIRSFSMPMNNGKPIPGMGMFMDAYRAEWAKNPYKADPGTSSIQGGKGDAASHRVKIIMNTLKKLRGTQGEYAAQLFKAGGTIPTQQVMLAKVLTYAPDDTLNPNTARFVKDASDSDKELYEKMNPGVTKSWYSLDDKHIYETTVLFGMEQPKQTMLNEEGKLDASVIDNVIHQYNEDKMMELGDILGQIEQSAI